MSSASEIGKGIYNGKNKIGKTVSLRSTIERENAKLNKHNFAAKYQLVYDKLRFLPKALGCGDPWFLDKIQKGSHTFMFIFLAFL